MTRRYQRLSASKSRTGWLAWAAWGIFGSIFLFEDIQGGSGWVTAIFTAPFWILFVVWPFLWMYLKTHQKPEYVDLDDDIEVGDVKARVVIKDGVTYVEKASWESTTGQICQGQSQKLPGGDEDFVTLDHLGKTQDKRITDWIAVVKALK